MKTAYIIITDKIPPEVMVQLQENKYIDTWRFVTAEDAFDLSRMAKFASERYSQTKAFKDGWYGLSYMYENYKQTFKKLGRYLRYH